MTKDEALKLALEKLETMNHEDSIFSGEFTEEIAAIKEALTQPEMRQPLTTGEIDLLAGKNQNNDGTVNYLPFARTIEAKLKEKNT